MLKEMLVQLDKSNAPDHLVQTLTHYRDITRAALNSFAHGGLHPIARTIEGYPPELAHDAIRNSNGLTTIAAQLNFIVSGTSQIWSRCANFMSASRTVFLSFDLTLSP
jgi:hypothetical protein